MKIGRSRNLRARKKTELGLKDEISIVSGYVVLGSLHTNTSLEMTPSLNPVLRCGCCVA